MGGEGIEFFTDGFFTDEGIEFFTDGNVRSGPCFRSRPNALLDEMCAVKHIRPVIIDKWEKCAQ